MRPIVTSVNKSQSQNQSSVLRDQLAVFQHRLYRHELVLFNSILLTKGLKATTDIAIKQTQKHKLGYNETHT